MFFHCSKLLLYLHASLSIFYYFYFVFGIKNSDVSFSWLAVLKDNFNTNSSLFKNLDTSNTNNLMNRKIIT